MVASTTNHASEEPKADINVGNCCGKVQCHSSSPKCLLVNGNDRTASASSGDGNMRGSGTIYSDFSEAISITKRYFTSLFSMRS